MIIVDPDEIVRLRVADDCIRIACVHLFISLPVCRLEIAEILQIVKQRPDHLVGIAVVEFVALGFTQRHRHDVITGVMGRFGQRPLWNFARDSRPTNPCATTLAQNWFNRGNKSADSRCDRPEILAGRIEREWQSVGDDYEAVYFQRLQELKKLHRYKDSTALLPL